MVDFEPAHPAINDPMPETPLLIPLKTEWYEAFASGKKVDELRRYGPRWNEKTCRVGRPVTLSKGYGRAHRMHGVVRDFQRHPARSFGEEYQAAIVDTYGTLDLDIACIGITLNKGDGSDG